MMDHSQRGLPILLMVPLLLTATRARVQVSTENRPKVPERLQMYPVVEWDSFRGAEDLEVEETSETAILAIQEIHFPGEGV